MVAVPNCSILLQSKKKGQCLHSEQGRGQVCTWFWNQPAQQRGKVCTLSWNQLRKGDGFAHGHGISSEKGDRSAHGHGISVLTRGERSAHDHRISSEEGRGLHMVMFGTLAQRAEHFAFSRGEPVLDQPMLDHPDKCVFDHSHLCTCRPCGTSL